MGTGCHWLPQKMEQFTMQQLGITQPWPLLTNLLYSKIRVISFSYYILILVLQIHIFVFYCKCSCKSYVSDYQTAKLRRNNFESCSCLSIGDLSEVKWR